MMILSVVFFVPAYDSHRTPLPHNLNRPILATAIFLTERSEVTNMVEILAILHMFVRIPWGKFRTIAMAIKYKF